MAEKKKWTIDEDNYVLGKVKEDPRVLSKVFAKCARHLGRTKGAVSTRYYTYITKHDTKENACFNLVSNGWTAQNRKQFSPNHTKRTPRGIFSALLEWLFR